MSIKIMTHVWEHSRHKGSALLLLLALADHANEIGFCHPALPLLSHKTRMNVRTVRRLLDELIESGELVRISVGSGRVSSEYRIAIEGGQNVHPERVPEPTQGGSTDPLRVGPQTLRTVIEPSLNHNPPTPHVDDDESIAAFILFWEIYPGRRKVDKKKCLRWWVNNVKPADRRPLMDGLNEWLASPEWKKNGGEFVPMPYTWLNNRRWETPPQYEQEEEGRWVG